MKKLETE